MLFFISWGDHKLLFYFILFFHFHFPVINSKIGLLVTFVCLLKHVPQQQKYKLNAKISSPIFYFIPKENKRKMEKDAMVRTPPIVALSMVLHNSSLHLFFSFYFRLSSWESAHWHPSCMCLFVLKGITNVYHLGIH